MQAGDLKHKALILYDASDGTTSADWQTLFDTCAAKKGLTGRLYYSAATAQSENDVLITIRFSSERLQKIKPTMRIALDGDTENYLEIKSDPVDVADKHQWLEIHAWRISQNGR